MMSWMALLRYLRLWMLLLMMGWWSTSFAQLHIDSRVVDGKTGKALPFATIYISGEKNTISNVEGGFVIDADSSDVLRISYVGYKSKYIPASEVKSKVRLDGEGRTLDEVVVMGTDYIVKKVIKKLQKEQKEYKKYQTHFFYRQTSRTGRKCTTYLEAFFVGKSAIQLVDLSLDQGRYVSVAGALTSNPLNFFTFAQVPVYKKNFPTYYADQLVPLVDDLHLYYNIDCRSISDGEKRTYVLTFKPRLINRWAVKGKLYVDSETFELLKYEGVGQNDRIRNGNKDNGHLLPADYSFVVNYQRDHGFTEVQSVHFDVSFTDNGKHYATSGMMFNVADRFTAGKGRMKFEDNLYKKIEDKGFDRDFWEKNEIVKRTPMEEEAKNIFERDNLIGLF